MCQLYRIELTDELTRFWLEALKELTPNQVRKGFMKYTQSDSCEFPPKPGQIIKASGYVWSPPRTVIDNTRYTITECERCGKSHESTNAQQSQTNALQCDHFDIVDGKRVAREMLR